MRLSNIEREFLQRVKDGKKLPPCDKMQTSIRGRLRRLGYVATVKLRWVITEAGLTALAWEPPATGLPQWRDMSPTQQRDVMMAFIADWCAEHRVNYNALCAAERSRDRRKLGIAMKVAFPDIGPSRAAIFLGGLDHTTVVNMWKRSGVYTPRVRRRMETRTPRSEKKIEIDRADRKFRQERRHVLRQEALQCLQAERR